MITLKNSNSIFYIFLFLHLLIWTLVPSFSNINLPLDTIEALAWGSNLDWGFNKHPPLSAFIVQVIYKIFGTNDWAYYLLSQVCVILSFYLIWELSKNFFQNKIFSLLSLFILESFVFFNYTTPEFNVYVCQLPLKAAAVYFFWKSSKNNKLQDWILTGIFCALGVLSHYSFIIIIISLFCYIILCLKKDKKLIKNFLISFIVFLFILVPHIFWLFENNFITISYVLMRTGIESKNFLNHVLNPIYFIFKQLSMMLFFLITFLSIISFKKIKKFQFKILDKKIIFLVTITILPFIIVIFISFLSGAKIRTMWMSTFYLFFGILFFYYFKKLIDLKKINNFLYIICFIFSLSPITYLYISISNDFKRTDFPGKEIARLVQNKWDNNFINEIKIVVGDEWSAGNLSYHLESRPAWFNELSNKSGEVNENQGVIYTGNPKILKKICPGVYGTIQPIGYCMIGKR